MFKDGKIQLNRRTLQKLTSDEIVQVAGGDDVDPVPGDGGGDRTPSVNCPPTADIKCCPNSCSD